ncbi:hypothetical protein [Sulfuriflexus mobilis]|uniref:hypothetical protein n=1 Tax=Sulfuriflexus mobilis TaxID=1811807 RepID=UPI000F83145D|nr:hypothetical protein [Sulfuriflexus mobilis]
MLARTVICLFPLMLGLPGHAQAIDLRCEELAENMVARLSSEGLIAGSAEAESRARAISLGLCAETQASARQQHEQEKAVALENWLFEHRADKPGNRRLRNLK